MTSDLKRYITYTLLALILTIIGGYTLFQFRYLVEGPSIRFLSQNIGSLVHNPIFPVEGVVHNVKGIQINGSNAFIDEAGNFNNTILLSEGYNVITVSGEDKFNRRTERKIELIYKKPTDQTASATSSKKVVATNSTTNPRVSN